MKNALILCGLIFISCNSIKPEKLTSKYIAKDTSLLFDKKVQVLSNDCNYVELIFKTIWNKTGVHLLNEESVMIINRTSCLDNLDRNKLKDMLGIPIYVLKKENDSLLIYNFEDYIIGTRIPPYLLIADIDSAGVVIKVSINGYPLSVH